MFKPDLSIIVPTLNEEQTLPLLLSDLSRQRGISSEVIVVDGGSTDVTCQIANMLFASGRLSGACRSGPRGRGRQLNVGAAEAKAEWMLFLHADSRLHDVNLLQRALEFMRSHRQRLSSDALAGRFALCFDAPEGGKGCGLYFYEVKAALGRSGCIHGDQGFLLSRALFHKIGPFREDLPVFEDTALAETIRSVGQWLLLPGEIITSARRFRSEGLMARQTLNALMMNFFAIGWLEFFARVPGVYRQQNQTQSLQLKPFFRLAKDLLGELPRRKRWAVWLATGEYVRSQVWQIGLAMDCRKAYRLGCRTVPEKCRWLNFTDRWIDPLTDHGLGRALTALLVKAWFSWKLRGNDE